MNPIQPATRTQTIKYAVRDILAVAEEAKQAGKQLLYLNIGDPIKFDFETKPVWALSVTLQAYSNSFAYNFQFKSA